MNLRNIKLERKIVFLCSQKKFLALQLTNQPTNQASKQASTQPTNQATKQPTNPMSIVVSKQTTKNVHRPHRLAFRRIQSTTHCHILLVPANTCHAVCIVPLSFVNKSCIIKPWWYNTKWFQRNISKAATRPPQRPPQNSSSSSSSGNLSYDSDLSPSRQSRHPALPRSPWGPRLVWWKLSKKSPADLATVLVIIFFGFELLMITTLWSFGGSHNGYLRHPTWQNL